MQVQHLWPGLAKKQGRYWPCNVPGYSNDENFCEKDIESRELLKQTIINFFVHCQKEEMYVAKIMSTHGTVNEVDFSDGRGKHIISLRPKQSKAYVNNHNNRKQDPIDIADTWTMKWLPDKQYSLFLAMLEVNANACWSHV